MKLNLITLLLLSLFSVQLTAQIENETIIKEDDGFRWTIVEKFNGKDFIRGAKTVEGKLIVPCEYSWIYYNDHYFYAIVESKDISAKALFSVEGKCIIPVDDNYEDLVVMSPKGMDSYIQTKKDGKFGVCSLDGEKIVDAKYDNIFVHDNNYYTKNKNGEMAIGPRKEGNTSNEDGKAFIDLLSLFGFGDYEDPLEGFYSVSGNDGADRKVNEKDKKESNSNASVTNSNNVSDWDWSIPDFQEYSDKFFSTSKTYNMVSYINILRYEEYKNNEASLTVKGKEITIKRSDGSTEKMYIVSGEKMLPVFSTENENLKMPLYEVKRPLYEVEGVSAVRAIKMQDGSIILFEYVYNKASGKYVNVFIYELK